MKLPLLLLLLLLLTLNACAQKRNFDYKYMVLHSFSTDVSKRSYSDTMHQPVRVIYDSTGKRLYLPRFRLYKDVAIRTDVINNRPIYVREDTLLTIIGTDTIPIKRIQYGPKGTILYFYNDNAVALIWHDYISMHYTPKAGRRRVLEFLYGTER